MRVPPTVCSLLVLVVLAACGGNDPGLPDAPPLPPDGRADATPPTSITVRVTQEDSEPSPGAPLADAMIAVMAPGATTPAIAMTDATGMATVPFAAGSTLWVDRRAAGSGPAGIASGFLYLVLDAAPGDSIEFGAPDPIDSSQAGTLSVTYSPMIGAAFYGFDGDNFYKPLTPCVDPPFAAAPGQVDYGTRTGCAAPSRDLVVTAFDINGAPSGWLRIPNVPATSALIDGTAAAWTTTGTDYTTNLTGMPADAAQVTTDVIAASSWHRVAMTTSLGGPTTGSSMTTDLGLTGPGLVVHKIDSFSNSPQYVVEPVAAVATTTTLDGAAILPMLSQADYDAGTRTISWTEATPAVTPTEPTLVTASFNFFDDVDGTVRRWTIYGGSSRTALVIPQVPDELVTHDLQGMQTPFPDLWYLAVGGASYSSLLTDVDLARGALYDLNTSDFDYRPTTRVLLSGGDGPPGK